MPPALQYTAGGNLHLMGRPLIDNLKSKFNIGRLSQ